MSAKTDIVLFNSFYIMSYTTEQLRDYLNQIYCQLNQPIKTSNFKRDECLKLWEIFNKKYKIVLFNDECVITGLNIRTPHYKKLADAFFVKPISSVKNLLEEWKDAKNFINIYNYILSFLPEGDQKLFKKIKYHWELKQPKLKLTDLQLSKLSEKWKKTYEKLLETFIA